jgi:hypothetical protein
MEKERQKKTEMETRSRKHRGVHIMNIIFIEN